MTTTSARASTSTLPPPQRRAELSAAPIVVPPPPERIRLLPAAGAFRVLVTLGAMALAAVSVVAAVIMVMYWQEGRQGLLTPTQADRVWDALVDLRTLQRWLALATLALVTGWSALAVANAGRATRTRLRPTASAVAWPVAAVAVWWIADLADGAATALLATALLAQALLLTVPFALLGRAVRAVGASRGALALCAGLCIGVLAVAQTLGGLATLARPDDPSGLGPAAVGFVLLATMHLGATASATTAMWRLADATADRVAHQDAIVDARLTAPPIVRSGTFMTAFETTVREAVVLAPPVFHMERLAPTKRPAAFPPPTVPPSMPTPAPPALEPSVPVPSRRTVPRHPALTPATARAALRTPPMLRPLPPAPTAAAEPTEAAIDDALRPPPLALPVERSVHLTIGSVDRPDSESAAAADGELATDLESVDGPTFGGVDADPHGVLVRVRSTSAQVDERFTSSQS